MYKAAKFDLRWFNLIRLRDYPDHNSHNSHINVTG